MRTLGGSSGGNLGYGHGNAFRTSKTKNHEQISFQFQKSLRRSLIGEFVWNMHHPVEVMEENRKLYERLLASEREKIEILREYKTQP